MSSDWEAQRQPLLDTSRYAVEYEDGSVDEMSANIIAEAVYAQVDDEGREFILLDAIIDHQRDSKIAARRLLKFLSDNDI